MKSMRSNNKITALALVLLCAASSVLAADQDLRLEDLQYTEHGKTTRMVITANLPFMYDIRNAGKGTLIVETDNADVSSLAPAYNIGSPVIDMISLATSGTGQDRKTEIIVKYNHNYNFSHSTQGRKLVVEFSRNGSPAAAIVNGNSRSLPLPEETKEEPGERPEPEEVQVSAPVETSKPEPRPRKQPAVSTPDRSSVRYSLMDVRELEGSGGTAILLDLDRAITRDDFKLIPVGGPKRFVIDFHYAHNKAGTMALRNASDYFTQVRIAQNRWDPHPVARVVVDIEDARIPREPEWEITGSDVILRFADATVAESPAQAAATKDAASDQIAENSAENAAEADKSIPEIEDIDFESTSDAAQEETSEVDAKPASSETPAGTGESQAKQARAQKDARDTAEELITPVNERKSEAAEETDPVNPWDSGESDSAMGEQDEEPRPVRKEEEIPARQDPGPDTMEADESLFDQAFPAEQDMAVQESDNRQATAASNGNQETRRPEAGDPDFFQTREIVSQVKEYTGKEVDLEFSNVQLNDLILILGQLTDKNFIVDPSVSNISVSIFMRNEPWDKALDVILDYHGLGKVEDGNLIRIATREKLAQEAEQKRRLQEQQALSVPLRQVAKPINYAEAADLVRLLSSNLSQKGTVVVDNRTNTLVITDIPSKVDEHLNLIDTLDIPTKQVYVEARIVETTRDFIHELGLQFGFNFAQDASTGNSTGLVFPNQFSLSGNPTLGLNPVGGTPLAVNLPSAEASSSIGGSFSNISGSFVLDAILTAAESERKVRVLSRPRISAQNNMKAVIKSGVEVPYQVIQNNTVSIRFREATLKLEVTPHITSDSTVILDVLVDKSSLGVRTDAGFSVQTRQATSTIRVKDGGVAVIGGVLEINDSYTEERTPFLHRLPLLGNLFKARLSRIQNTELIIFISPKIIG